MAVIIAACAAGAVLALAAVLAGFLLYRRKQRRLQQQEHLPPGQPVGKWSSKEGGEVDVVPLPKQLKPIATGRGRTAAAAPSAASPGQRHLSAAAGAAAAHQLHQQQSGAAGTYMAAVAQLQQYAPEYHVVHMPSPRFAGG